MAKDKIPATPAIRLLKQYKVKVIPCPYRYENKNGTRTSARGFLVEITPVDLSNILNPTTVAVAI